VGERGEGERGGWGEREEGGRRTCTAIGFITSEGYDHMYVHVSVAGRCVTL
jgi:hypothetical protein